MTSSGFLTAVSLEGEPACHAVASGRSGVASRIYAAEITAQRSFALHLVSKMCHFVFRRDQELCY